MGDIRFVSTLKRLNVVPYCVCVCATVCLCIFMRTVNGAKRGTYKFANASTLGVDCLDCSASVGTVAEHSIA